MNDYQLTENERYQIYALNKAGHSQIEIAELLNRSPSTISRKLARNKGLKGYRPAQAQRLTDDRRKAANKARQLMDDIKMKIGGSRIGD